MTSQSIRRTASQTATKLPISVMIQTKNEEVGIAACIDALQDFDQVVVVDSMSTDRTQEIAREHGADVVPFDWNGEYPKKKQWMLERGPARHDWVLIMDADETPRPELIAELRERLEELNAKTYAAYDIQLDYVFNGRLLQHGHRVVKRTLVDRTRTFYPRVDDLDAPGMGELEGHYQPRTDGPVGLLNGRILHDDQDPIRSWFDRHNRYSDWEAFLRTHPEVARQANGARSRQGQIFARVPFKPAAFFLYDYLVRQGFRDGAAGFNYAFALSWYYWLTDVKVAESKRHAPRR